MSGITTTIQKPGPTGRVEREVEVTEVPTGDMGALDITKERLAVIERMAREGATDAVCATCQGTGIDPDPADLEPGNDQCPECKGSGRADPDPVEGEPPPVPPTGMGQPPIDHDEVTAAAEALNGAGFTRAQAAAVKALYRTLEGIRVDRQALSDRKANAKAAFVKAFPEADFASVMIAYNVYIAEDAEASAAAQMRRVADTVKDVADMYQPALF